MNNLLTQKGLSQAPALTANISVPSLSRAKAKPAPKPVQPPNPSKTFVMPVGGVDQNKIAMNPYAKALATKTT